MSLVTISINLATIARRIKADIQTHQLREGSRYRTASDIGKMLEISPTMAHRAMSLLVQSKVLVRKQGSGTYIGPAATSRQSNHTITIDHKAAGDALASQLISRGHKRIALFATTNWRPGDNAFYDGVNDALTRSGMPPNTIVMRLFPDATELFRVQTNELLTADDRPTAIICATQFHISAIVDLVRPLGLTIGKDLELTYHGLTQFPNGSIPLVSAVPEYSFETIAQKLSEMLIMQQNGSLPADRQTRIPVKLILPV